MAKVSAPVRSYQVCVTSMLDCINTICIRRTLSSSGRRLGKAEPLCEGPKQALQGPIAHRHMLSSVRRNLSPDSPLGTKLTAGHVTTGSRRRLINSCCSMPPRASAAWTAAVQTSSRACKRTECSSLYAHVEASADPTLAEPQ